MMKLNSPKLLAGLCIVAGVLLYDVIAHGKPNFIKAIVVGLVTFLFIYYRESRQSK